jgi:tetratricopeptide (TPR) repeat protein
MAYHEEEQLKMKRLNTKQAIALAMQGHWREAITTNKAIVDSFPDDVDAFNRLGRAYMETGAYKDSKKAYEKSLVLDPYNSIAKKNLQRLNHLAAESSVATKEQVHVVEPQFIEEAGKSGVVALQRLASPGVLVRLVAGEKVFLKASDKNLQVKSAAGEYIGQIEPRHGQRLIKMIDGGNKYSSAIISVSENKAVVIIRETFQSPNFVGQPSFPPRWAENLRSYDGDRETESRWEEEEESDEPRIASEEDSDVVPEDFSPTDEVENAEE